MRILLDECVPRPLRKEMIGHEVRIVRQMRWAGIENGDLLRLAETAFDVFLTTDQNIPYQQNLSGFQIAMMVMVARTNRLQDLQPLIPSVLDALQTLQQGTLMVIEARAE